jgi:hypothetical protein
MPIANLLAMVLGFVMVGTGVLGVATPSVLVELGRSLHSPSAVYLIGAVRVGFGAILFWAAPNSRTPRTFRVLGAFIIIAGLVAPFLGVERSHAVFDWWSTGGSFFTHAWPIAAVVVGLFIAYATSPRASGT